MATGLSQGTSAGVPPDAEPPPATSAVASDPVAAPLPYSILLVDDDGLVCRTTAMLLADLGHQVREALSGKAALEILRSGAAIDLVLTDQAMPGMTGLQLAAQIRESWPEMPIILTTGYADLPDRLNLPRVLKPYGQEEIAAAIAGVMGS
jgi:CheY-like chemotaxis protein